MNEASACAKAILFGEHAVVYGMPAIAVPVSGLRAYATIQPSDGGLHVASGRLRIPVDVDAESVDNALALTARLTLRALNAAPPDVLITIRSDIPIASGLGSGAAVSTALARAICQAVGKTLNETTLNRVIYEVEKIHHGTPSGIDNTVIVYERPVYFVRGLPIETLTIGKPFTLLIADTGVSASTKAAVASVREFYERDHQNVQMMLRYIRRKVWIARQAIALGDLAKIGEMMTINHKVLQELTVSSPELDALIDAATKAGALGAKLSGGGRGGNMIALVMPDTCDQVTVALKGAGAVRVFRTEVA